MNAEALVESTHQSTESDGTRTRYFQIHNLVLCQMSYRASPHPKTPFTEHGQLMSRLKPPRRRQVQRRWLDTDNPSRFGRRPGVRSVVRRHSSQCSAERYRPRLAFLNYGTDGDANPDEK